MENTNEIWKPVVGYEGLYEVSNIGRVRTVGNNKTKKTKIRKQVVTNLGYKQVQLYKDGKQKLLYVHRIVAEAFILNADNKFCIDHINTDRGDNRVENLRWCTQKENINNPITIKNWENTHKNSLYQSGKFGKEHNRSKIIYQYSKDGEFIKEWYGASEIKRQLGLCDVSVRYCCQGKRKTYGGFIWKYTI